ncbi:hypothetical protein [Saccharothrix sp. HUAS TT1]|uniref:hypothetical protein n=1 Tax=unclassified Saccharothrix TaxID=2593673 RepID=UPI00345C1983
MKISLTVCDVCQERSVPAKTYRVTDVTTGLEVQKDLCAEHGGEQLDQLLADAPTPTGRASPAAPTEGAPSSGRKRKVVKTLAQVEAEKAAAKQ